MVLAYSDAGTTGYPDFLLLKTDTVFDHSLCNMKLPALVKDTLDFSETSFVSSTPVTTIHAAVNFNVMPGVNENYSCNIVQSTETTGNIFNFENYPNPFSDKTIISFQTKNSCRLTLEIFDVNGRKVFEKNESENSSIHRHEINPFDTFGNRWNAGIYNCRFSDSGNRYNVKIILLY
jgi:hypothetical protein